MSYRRYLNERDRITLNVRVDEAGCWIWQLHTTAAGYGLVRPSKREGTVLAHRRSYETFIGPIPDGLHVDHLCRVRACVNPAHLEPVTCRENLLRSPLTFQARNAAKTRCPREHPYDETNTRWSKGSRYCRTCDRARRRDAA